MIIKRWSKHSCPFIQELTRIIIGVTYEEPHIWDAPHSAAFLLLLERDPLVPLYRDWADLSCTRPFIHPFTHSSSLIILRVGEKGLIITFSYFSSTHLIFWICIIAKKICSPLPLFPFPKSGYLRGGLGSLNCVARIHLSCQLIGKESKVDVRLL